MNEIINNFHFIRPAWLLAFIPFLTVAWHLRRHRDPRSGLSADIAPHLLNQLITSPSDRPRVRPATTLLPLGMIGIIAIAGPSYRRVPSPFADDKAELMVVIKMTPSMETADLMPSRLERSRTKLHDLLETRKGAGTALIAYAGSAHLVMPTTDDSSVIEHMLEALKPEIMPIEGDALVDALTVASTRLKQRGSAGSILVVCDSVASNQQALLEQWRNENTVGVQFLASLRDRATLDQSGILDAAKSLRSDTELVAADDRDVRRIANRADQAIVSSVDDELTQWRDEGYLLIPFLAFGILIWCRRGWSLSA